MQLDEYLMTSCFVPIGINLVPDNFLNPQKIALIRKKRALIF